MIPEEKIREVRERVDIVEVVSRHVQLRRKGQNHFGLCPFHAEKSPSFSVHAGKQIYYCFGCHETGSVFDFVMRVEGRSFIETVRHFAAEVGVALPEYERSPEAERAAREARTERDRLLALNDKVARFYREQLAGKAGGGAREYIAKRGIGAEVSESFRLGFAPDAWDTLATWLGAEKVPLTLAEKAGVLIPRRSGGGYIDRFRGRVIFPLLGPSGEVIGFGGRILADKPDEAKYLNTPETPLYRKGEALYGLHVARKAMAHGEEAIVVEGNFDVLALHQAGLASAVAPMGTALTPRQVTLLSRFAKSAVAMFDGDGAGRAAALKAVRTFLEGGLDARIARLPDGEDPDTLARGRGADAVTALVKNARASIDYFLDDLLARTGASIPERVKALEESAPLLASVDNDTVRDLYAGKLAAALKLDVARVRQVARGAAPAASAAAGAKAPAAPVEAPPDRELSVLSLLGDHPHLCARFVAAGGIGLVGHEALRGVIAALCERAGAGEPDWQSLVAVAPESLRETVARVLMSSPFSAAEGAEFAPSPERALDEALATLRKRRLAGESADLRRRAREAAERGDEQGVREIQQRLRSIELERHDRTLGVP